VSGAPDHTGTDSAAPSGQAAPDSAAPSAVYTTARELFEALRASELKVRAQATAQVGRDPAAAYELGMHAGRDLVDVLIQLLRDEPRGSVFGQAFARILSLFSDPRVTDLFTAGVAEWTEFVRLEAALAYLGAVSPDSIRGLLFDEARSDLRHGAARSLLAARAALSAREALRAALLEGLPTPKLSRDSLPEWLAELSGPMRHAATQRLSRQDEEGLRALLGAWPVLAPPLQAATLKAARRIAPGATTTVLPEAFRSAHTDTLLAAFQCLDALDRGAAMPDGPWRITPDAVRPPISRFVASRDRRVICAAIRQAALDVDLDATFGPAATVEVQCAILQRRAEEAPESALSLWLAAMVHPHWQLRGLAARQLAAHGPQAHEDVRALLESPRAEVRLAAGQALRHGPADAIRPRQAPAAAGEPRG
jgi:hypothetical protein